MDMEVDIREKSEISIDIITNSNLQKPSIDSND